jgi:threonine/homoserine/homoserine lactone efflux protein
VFGTQNLALFVVSGILLNLTPGQDTFYIVGRSIAQGRRAGILSAFGITSGSAVHTVAAALGLSAILAVSGTALLIVKLCGAAYLGYLGVRMIFERGTSPSEPATFGRDSDWAIFRAGFFTNVLNPKVALFFLAFLPQFVSPGADSQILTLLFLGGIFMTTGTTWCLILAWSAAAMSRRFRENPSTSLKLKRATGAVFVGLGVKLAVSR